MSANYQKIVKTYLLLTLLTTLGSSLIWGINTLFLLSAGLSITEAFAANAFFTLGQVIFEVPTGVVADTAGRRKSYLLGTLILFAATALYLFLWHIGSAPFWQWAGASMLLGLGFTFFSGATEAWLVDGVISTNPKANLESVFSKGQVVTGIAMLVGAISGGVIAQVTNLGVPYILRSGILLITFFVAYHFMHDVGFAPKKSLSLGKEIKEHVKISAKYGFVNAPVRWIILSSLFTMGVGIYGFYALQPYLLELANKTESYAIAGAGAAIVAVAQIGGGLLAPKFRSLFKKRTSALLLLGLLTSAVLVAIGALPHFWAVIIFITMWAILFAAVTPIRQAYLNGLIPSNQRATVLSSDNLIASAGSAVIQPGLGRMAEAKGYPASYVFGGLLSLLALPLIYLARHAKAKSDLVEEVVEQLPGQPSL